MKGVVKTGYVLKVRDIVGADTGDKLFAGDTFYGNIEHNRISYNKIYRANGATVGFSEPHNSAVGDGITEWMTLTNEAEPTPPPVPDAVRLVIESTELRIIVRDDATGKRFSGVVMADGLDVEMVEIA